MQEEIKNKGMAKLIIIMSLPPIISMFIQSLYSIVDAIFVAKISTEAFNAISIAYPITNLTLALAVGFGVGLNSVISRSLGMKDNENVQKCASHFFILSFIHYIIFIIVGLIIIKPFFSWFTTNNETIRYGKIYLSILLFSCIGQLLHISIEKIFQAYGKMKVPMIAQGLGCIINIILDAVFIYVFKWGIAGAAVATVIGQFSSFIYIFIIGLKYKYIKIDKSLFKLDKRIIKNIYIVAIPSTIMGSLISILTLIFNMILKGFGEDYVTILGAYFKLQAFLYMPANGMIQGIRPIFGYLYGAEDKKTLKEAIKDSMLIMTIFTIIGFILFETMPKLLLLSYISDSEVLNKGITCLRIIAIGFIPSGFSLVIMSFYESIGKGLPSLIISTSRQAIIPIVYVIIAIKALKYNYLQVWISFPVSEIFTFIISIIIFIITTKIDKVLNQKDINLDLLNN